MHRTTSNHEHFFSEFDIHARKKSITLSNRESEILLLISHEHSEKSISKILKISYHTVHAHKRNLLRKLGASNAAGLVRKGFERKILS